MSGYPTKRIINAVAAEERTVIRCFLLDKLNEAWANLGRARMAARCEPNRGSSALVRYWSGTVTGLRWLLAECPPNGGEYNGDPAH